MMDSIMEASMCCGLLSREVTEASEMDVHYVAHVRAEVKLMKLGRRSSFVVVRAEIWNSGC
jgi:hypothetical protein